MMRRISREDFSQLHASFGSLQGFADLMFINDKSESSLDCFRFGFGAEDGFGASELVLIKLEMFVAYRGCVAHAPSE
jgi:hypothetical protein